MPPSSAPPSSGCAASTLLLQRRLFVGDCAKWRTVLRVGSAHIAAAQALVAAAQGIDLTVEWRIVLDAES